MEKYRTIFLISDLDMLFNLKNLYITNTNSSTGLVALKLNGSLTDTYDIAYESNSLLSPLIFTANDTLSIYPVNYDVKIFGLLVDKIVTPIYHNFNSGNFTVPNGKSFYVLNTQSSTGQVSLRLNGSSTDSYDINYQSSSLNTPLVFKSNDEISIFPSNYEVILLGYMTDENFFTNCGASNSSNGNTSNSSNIQIGDYTNGGIVFYVDSTGQHGKVMTPFDVMNYNTNSDQNMAITVCNNLTANGFSDWYLPEVDDLQMIHDNLGNGGFGLSWAWSSSTAYTVWHYWSATIADPSQWTNAGWTINFENGNQVVTVKNNDCRIRAVRNF